MILKTEHEIWIQGLYGKNWEDFQEMIDVAHAKETLITLQRNRPTGIFRVIQRTTVDLLLCKE
jgi:hypothetical protein